LRSHAADAAYPHGTVVPPGFPENNPDVTEGSGTLLTAEEPAVADEFAPWLC
jgi:hypothetical protein